MFYRFIGKTEVQVSVISLGVWSLAHKVWSNPDGEALVANIINAVIDNGITTIDTAPTYGMGWCDEVIGRAIRGKRDKVQISTKYGQRWDKSEGFFSFEINSPCGEKVKIMRNSRPDSIVEECEQALLRLQTDYIDIYQCHWPDPTTPIEESMRAIDLLLKQGKIRAAGVSNFSVEQMAEACAVVPLAVSQSPYNMLDRQIEKDIMPWCVKRDISILAYSPLQSGILAIEDMACLVEAIWQKRDFFKSANIQDLKMVIEKLKFIANSYNVSLSQLALNWVIANPNVASAICGATSIKKIEQNLRGMEIKISSEDSCKIDELLDQL